MRPIAPTLSSRFRVLFGVGLVGLLVGVFGLSGVAKAETFQYWSLWVGADGQWEPADKLAGELELADESVLGAVFLESDREIEPDQAPVESAVYSDLCPAGEPVEGKVRVAVVIEFGDPSIAHEGQHPEGNIAHCVVLDEPATAAQALHEAAHVTMDSDGFITAINDFGDHAPDQTEDVSDAGVWVLLVLVVVAVVVILAVLVARNRDTDPDADDEESAGKDDTEPPAETQGDNETKAKTQVEAESGGDTEAPAKNEDGEHRQA